MVMIVSGWLIVSLVIFWFIYLMINGNLSQADYNSRIAKSPDQPELYYLRGCNHQSFLNTYQNPFKSDEQHHEDWTREEKLAIEDFSKAIQLAPDFASAYYQRARCKSWHNFRPELAASAIADYKKALELVPFDGWVHLDLARLYGHLPEFRDQAIHEYETAISLEVDDGKVQAERELKVLQKSK